MGLKKTTIRLNAAGIRTRDGGRLSIGAVHKVLTRTTYIGGFNTKFWKTRERKPDTVVVEMGARPIIDAAGFNAVQALLKTRCPAVAAPRIVSPTLLPASASVPAAAMPRRLRTRKSGPTSLLYYLLDRGPRCATSGPAPRRETIGPIFRKSGFPCIKIRVLLALASRQFRTLWRNENEHP
jgi:hypothetical protein